MAVASALGMSAGCKVRAVHDGSSPRTCTPPHRARLRHHSRGAINVLAVGVRQSHACGSVRLRDGDRIRDMSTAGRAPVR